MLPFVPLVTQHAEEGQRLLLQDSSSTELYETSSENVSRSSLCSGLSMRPHIAFFVLAVLVLLIVRAFHCSLSISKRPTSELRQRRLAGGKEGAGQDGEDQTESESCLTVGELVAPRGEAGSSGMPLPSAQAAASAEDEAAAEGTERRKRKRKTKKDFEESSEKQAKTARVSSMETLQSTGEPPNPIEEPYSGPSTAPHFSGSYPAGLSTAGMGVVSEPSSQPRTGTLPEDPSSSESTGTSSQESLLLFSEELSVGEVIEGMLDAEVLGFEDWLLDPSASLPLFLEQESDSDQEPRDPQPSESGYGISLFVTQEKTERLLSEEAADQQGQRQSPSPSSPLEGTSRSHLFFQPPPVMAAPASRKVVQVAPSTSSAFPGAPPHSSHSLPPQMPPSSEAIPSTRRRSRARKAASRRSFASCIPEPLTKEQCMGHPSYVLPTAERGGTLSPFNLSRAAGYGRASVANLLLFVAEQFRKKHLTTGDLKSLIDKAEGLYGNAYAFMSTKISFSHFAGAVIPLTYRFLVINYLWCICEVVGPPMRKENWWGTLMSRMIPDPPPLTEKAPEGSREDLFQRLILALEDFKQGRRPSARLLVSILQRVFNKSSGIQYFKATEWDFWREDDSQYRESLRRQEEESKDEKE